MHVIEALKNASRRIYESTRGMAGTEGAAGDFGIGAGGDVSRNIDITAESAVLEYLREVGFGCTVLGEECGRVEISGNAGGTRGCLIMDAIDGSANAVRGVPFFCSSLAFAAGDSLGSVTDAVITDLFSGDSYWASRGAGAFLNGQKIHVRTADPIYKIVGINMSGATPELMQKMRPVFEQHNHTRHFGANALEMALLARGALDVYMDLRGKLRIQDVAAGCLIAREAGGLVLDESMEQLDAGLDYETRISFVAASSKAMLDDVLAGVPADP